MTTTTATECEHGVAAPKYCAFCRRAAQEAKDEGIATAIQADEDWYGQAISCIRAMARTGAPFTAEDIVDQIGAPTGSGKVIGAAMNAVAKSGMIWRCGEKPATRKTSHRRMLAIWRGGQVQEPLYREADTP